MNHNKITKHLMAMNKTAFDTTFKTLTVPQDNSRRFFFGFASKNLLFPHHSKNTFIEYARAERKRKTELKSHLDDVFEKVADYFMERDSQNLST